MRPNLTQSRLIKVCIEEGALVPVELVPGVPAFAKAMADKLDSRAGGAGCIRLRQKATARQAGRRSHRWVWRNLAKLKSIKVDQGDKFSKKKESPHETADWGWCPRPGRAGARRSKLAGQRPALPVVGGARMDENLAKLKPIKVDQGWFFRNEQAQNDIGCFPDMCGDRAVPTPESLVSGQPAYESIGGPAARTRKVQIACEFDSSNMFPPCCGWSPTQPRSGGNAGMRSRRHIPTN